MGDRDEVERDLRDDGVREILQPDDRRALYGPGVSDDERRAVAARLQDAAPQRVGADAPRGADDENADRPDAEARPRTAAPQAAAEARRRIGWRRAAVLVPAAAVVAILALALGYALGTARRPVAPGAADRPTPTALPTVLYLDDRDGEVLHLEYRRRGDPRSVQARLPEMLAGWSMATACLARNSRPRTVPTQTVLLLDGAGRQLGSWTVPCDTAERRYFAIAAPAHPTTVQLLLVLDDSDVRAGWATIDPNR
jgi:hypothetical protein